jgi:hypothetical protein
MPIFGRRVDGILTIETTNNGLALRPLLYYYLHMGVAAGQAFSIFE